MSLHPVPGSIVPHQTLVVARAIFPRSHAYLDLRDTLGPIFADAQFASLFAACGQPAECPWLLALVTLPVGLNEGRRSGRTAGSTRTIMAGISARLV